MITNPIVNTDDTIGGVDKSRKYKERRVVLNINSLQRSQFKEIPIEETDEYTDLGLSRDENGTYTREEIDDEENISIIEVTAEELNNEFEPGPTDVPRPYVPKNNGDIIKYEYNFRTPDYYEFMLPKIFNNVKSVRLLSSEVPNTINTVNSRNNLILLDIRDEDTGGSISLKPNSSPFSFFLLQIPTGNYTLNSIATILEDLINETVKLYSVDEYEDIITVTTNIAKGEFRFEINQPEGKSLTFHLRFWFLQGIDQFNGLWYLLGFNLPYERNTDGSSLYATSRSNLFDFGLNSLLSGITTSSIYNDLRPFRFPDLQPHKYIYLVIEGLGTIYDLANPDYTSFESNDIFAKIILNVSPNETAFNTFISNPKVFERTPLDKLEKLVVRWLDHAGNPVDFSFRNHSFVIEITQYIDLLTINDYSTKRGVIDHSSYSEVVKFG